MCAHYSMSLSLFFFPYFFHSLRLCLFLFESLRSLSLSLPHRLIYDRWICLSFVYNSTFFFFNITYTHSTIRPGILTWHNGTLAVHSDTIHEGKFHWLANTCHDDRAVFIRPVDNSRINAFWMNLLSLWIVMNIIRTSLINVRNFNDLIFKNSK